MGIRSTSCYTGALVAFHAIPVHPVFILQDIAQNSGSSDENSVFSGAFKIIPGGANSLRIIIKIITINEGKHF